MAKEERLVNVEKGTSWNLNTQAVNKYVTEELRVVPTKLDKNMKLL